MSQNRSECSTKISEETNLCSKVVETGVVSTPNSKEKCKEVLLKHGTRKRKNNIPRWIELAEESYKRQRKIVYDSSSDDEKISPAQPIQPKPEHTDNKVEKLAATKGRRKVLF